MKTFKILLIASLLSILPVTTSYAQLPEVSNSMAQIEAVSINSADAKMLAKLPGIGKKKAQAIVNYRDENGVFTSLEDLAKVKGIGKKVMSKLEGKVKL
ncbi:helix-hairpin-helix domain-containing protein [Pseudoalteromonas sp. CR1]|uniref:ComEA family DNA-binding protein n=1 Tax=Pseudoalteromonas sp. CR1 TaxID=2861964 RepID=UPI001C5E9F3D|nr:helix-hairpin-helix domain-containing protein [Pseudoalteromonas sp. CR1]MBW4966416.1 helix-hairpin-helix domain-containing protein [Pseudoalteromonas sp. CR1]